MKELPGLSEYEVSCSNILTVVVLSILPEISVKSRD